MEVPMRGKRLATRARDATQKRNKLKLYAHMGDSFPCRRHVCDLPGMFVSSGKLRDVTQGLKICLARVSCRKFASRYWKSSRNAAVSCLAGLS